jgi:hypothetical protein
MKSNLPIPGSAHPPARGRAGRREFSGLSVRTNGIWSLLGNGVFAASQLGMLVVMARLGTKELVGTYALGLALTSPVFLLFALQLRTLLASDAAVADWSVYFSVRLTTTAMATVVAAVIGWQFMAPGTAAVALAIAVSKAIDSIHDLLYGMYWRSDRMDYIAKSMLLRAIGGLAVFALAFHLTGSLSVAVFSLCAVWMIVLLAYDGPVIGMLFEPGSAPWWLPGWSSTAAKHLIWLGFPAGILSWLVSLQMYVPRYVVQHRL